MGATTTPARCAAGAKAIACWFAGERAPNGPEPRFAALGLLNATGGRRPQRPRTDFRELIPLWASMSLLDVERAGHQQRDEPRKCERNCEESEHHHREHDQSPLSLAGHPRRPMEATCQSTAGADVTHVTQWSIARGGAVAWLPGQERADMKREAAKRGGLPCSNTGIPWIVI